jgi:hypothetical protein
MNGRNTGSVMKAAWRGLLGLGLCGLGVLVLAGCSTASARVTEVRVAGAIDVLPLAGGVQKEFSRTTGLSVTLITSTTSLADLQAGRADVVVLGREPTPDELRNTDDHSVDDHVVAYDAVCLLEATRVYSGGLQANFAMKPPDWKAKLEGLQNLVHSEVQAWFGNQLMKTKYFWRWMGPFWRFKAQRDANGSILPDPYSPDVPQGSWVRSPAFLQGELQLPGRFDTQDVLLAKLGFSAADLANPNIAFVPRFYETEEELISKHFDLQNIPDEAMYDFDFYVLPVSRRVTMRALQYHFKVRAIAIDGIDPITDAQSIYGGSYLLSRKIHVLTRKSAPAAAQSFVQFLLSPGGQQLIAQAYFLPLPPSR